MSPVEFKKTSCRPVDFKGQGFPGGAVVLNIDWRYVGNICGSIACHFVQTRPCCVVI